MSLSDSFEEQEVFVLTRLLRAGEEGALSWPVAMNSSDANYKLVVSWVLFIKDRYEGYRKIVDSGLMKGVPRGYAYAAVRLFGHEALSALSSVLEGTKLPAWQSPAHAEQFLNKVVPSHYHRRTPWERG